MSNDTIAAALAEIGTLLELSGENPFRANAYHVAARAIEAHPSPVADMVRAKAVKISGVGATLTEKLEALVNTGTTDLLDELRAKIPAGMVQLLRVPGLGPKKILALAAAGFGDPALLAAGCQSGAVAQLKGFGAKTAAKIAEGLTFLDQVGGRVRLDHADALAAPILAAIRTAPGVARAEACGSLRRRRETVGDLDFLVAAPDASPVADVFVAQPGVADVITRGDTLVSVNLVADARTGQRLRADLRVVSAAQFPFGLHHLTGSKAHNVAVRRRAIDRGYSLNEYALTGFTGPVRDEADIFAALGLPFIPPELREDAGEFTSPIPQLIEVNDVRGVFHNHTTASDGVDTLEAMAAAARALGLQYLGIADHSQSLTVARGLTPDRVREQQAAIDRLNDTFTDFRLFKGTECDILPDGSLDFDDELLKTFDYVVASVHTHFSMSRDDMTARVVKAVRHPRVTMLGHSTGRLLLRRDAYAIDLDAVLKAAADAGTMVEINAQPARLDVDWVHARRAKDLGVPLVINPDAHSTGELALYRYGVDVARRAWLTKADVFNTLPLSAVSSRLASRRAS